jgi:phenylacetate-CoA ligase
MAGDSQNRFRGKQSATNGSICFRSFGLNIGTIRMEIRNHTRRNAGETLRESFLRKFLLPAGDRFFGSGMMKRLAFLEEAQWWPVEKVYEYRDQLLTKLIHTAYREVPFYRELMDRSGVRPEEVRSQQDLSRLPIVTKELLRLHYPEKTTRPTGQKTFEVHTSGSTGTNFRVLSDSQTASSHRASFLLTLQWAGWNFGERHMQTGMTLHRNLERRLKDFVLRCHYVSAYQLDDDRLDKALATLERYNIQHLWGYPGSIYLIARRAIERGCNPPLRSVVTWGDNLFDHYRKTIELAFKTKVTDNYGCAEGIQIAAQCGESPNYHLHSLDVVVEYVDDDGSAVPEGQSGNLILTRLFPGPMPLIRYRVGDIGVSGKSQTCKCGRGFEMMQSIQGRDTDFILTPSGNRLLVHFFTGIIEHFPEIDSFQVIQQTPASALLRIVPAKEFSTEVTQRMVAILKERGASDLNFDVELVSEIPLPPNGKRRFITSRLAQPLISNHAQALS